MSGGTTYCARCGVPFNRYEEQDPFMHAKCRELQKQDDERYGGLKPNRKMRRAAAKPKKRK